jgi:hypothetical protein
MKQQYLSNPPGAVRDQSFINFLHDYCVEEIQQAAINSDIERLKSANSITIPPRANNFIYEVDLKGDLLIVKEATLFGSHKPKNVDVSVIDLINGPQIIVGIRSQMSSVAKNILTYYEEIIGDCISLHDRFPMAVISYIYLLPKHPIKGDMTENVNLDRSEDLFLRITGREDWRDTKDKYEHFAFLKVDFDKDPPELLDTAELLKIDDFFDKIIATYSNRKPL